MLTEEKVPVLNFGKYKGKPVNCVPSSYQMWLINNCKSFLKEKHSEVWTYLASHKNEIEEEYQASIPFWFDLIDFD